MCRLGQNCLERRLNKRGTLVSNYFFVRLCTRLRFMSSLNPVSAFVDRLGCEM
jgi:hypothetical protein